MPLNIVNYSCSIIIKNGWCVLWRDEGGRDAGLMYGLQEHSCAVLSSGAVSCWGYNGYGQVIAAACSRGGLGVRGEILSC